LYNHHNSVKRIGEVIFNKEIIGINSKDDEVVVKYEGGEETFDWVFGADG